MSEEIKVPSVGESVSEGVLATWSKKDGEFVELEETLFELETDKVTMPVNSPFEGVLHVQVKEGEAVNIGDVVATIDTGAKRPAEAKPKEKSAPEKKAEESSAKEERKKAAEEEKKAKAKVEEVKKTSGGGAATQVEDFPPSVRRMLEEYDLDPAKISGTGREGRVTKEDVVRFLEDRKKVDVGRKKPQGLKVVVEEAPAVETESLARSTSGGPTGERRQTRTPMSPLRKRVGQRLVEAQQTAAMVTTYNEADLSAVLRIREQYNEAFEKRYGIRMGFMSFFVKASVDALKTVPALNAQIDGDELVQNHFYDIGVAVSTDKGLVVPILRDCDRMSLAELEKAIHDYAQRARDRKLTLDDLKGGCFSISNGGVFGSLLSAPMLNPPQSGILGMHAIKKRPVVIDDRVEARSMMYLALTYDHRVVDGREGVTFLKRIVECIENPERMLLEV